MNGEVWHNLLYNLLFVLRSLICLTQHKNIFFQGLNDAQEIEGFA